MVMLRIRNRVGLRSRYRVQGKVRGFSMGFKLVSERGFRKVVLLHPKHC